jgi:hypothetical protein
MTKEHTISKSQFGDAAKVTIHGFPWCRDSPKEIGIGDLVSKVLCNVHNHGLSPVDTAASQVLEAITLAYGRARTAQGSPQRFPRKVVRVDGDAFERWLLKTAINLALLEQPRPRNGIFDETGQPTKRYVEIAFGVPNSRFDVDEGLYWFATVGEQIARNQVGTLAFASWRGKEDDALVGIQVRFHGYRLWFATRGAPGVQGAIHPMRRWDADNVDVRLEFGWPSWREKQFLTLQRP